MEHYVKISSAINWGTKFVNNGESVAASDKILFKTTKSVTRGK